MPAEESCLFELQHSKTCSVNCRRVRWAAAPHRRCRGWLSWAASCCRCEKDICTRCAASAAYLVESVGPGWCEVAAWGAADYPVFRVCQRRKASDLCPANCRPCCCGCPPRGRPRPSAAAMPVVTARTQAALLAALAAHSGAPTPCCCNGTRARSSPLTTSSSGAGAMAR